MKDGLAGLSLTKKTILLIVIVSTFFLYLFFLKKPPLSEQEIVNITISRSLRSGNFSELNFQNFIRNNGFYSQPIPELFNFVTINSLPHILSLHKFQGIILLSLVAFIYHRLFISEFASKEKKLALVITLLFILSSPWLIQSAIYKPNVLIRILFFIPASFYFYKLSASRSESTIKRFLVFNTLLALTGFAGLLSSVVFLFFFIFNFKARTKKFKLIPALTILSIASLIGIFILNRSYYFEKLQKGSLLTKIDPIVLTHQIDERQMIDYLSTNKEFILPAIVRKFTYNKLSFASDIILRKSISLFDFEQLASPNESYDITNLSGILPRGNLPLIYVWEIPLFVFGIYLVYKDHKNKRYWFTTMLLASLLPALIFEKKDFAEYAIFFHTPIVIAELLILITIFKVLSGKKIIQKLTTISFVVIIFISLVNFLSFLFSSDYHYLPPNLTAHQKISNWISENHSESSEFTITNRFGPTQYSIPAYVGHNFGNYWDNYNSESVTYNNLTFEQIDFSKGKYEKDRFYLGFPGEFIGETEILDINSLPSYHELVGELELNDELVYKFGKDIWIVKPR